MTLVPSYNNLWQNEIAVRFVAPDIGLAPFDIAKLSDGTRIDISTCCHPTYYPKEWESWRLAYEGGRAFVENSMIRFSKREKQSEFLARKALSTIPAFAASAIDDIINAIFQRMADVARNGGSRSYQSAVAGENGGVNKAGNSLTGFLGTQVIPELLVMRRVGIFVDATAVQPAQPYLYVYKSEDILNWYPEHGPLELVVLRDYVPLMHPVFRIPVGWSCRYRLLYLRDEGVGVVVFDSDGKTVLSNTVLALPEIPVVIPCLSHSLMKNVAGHQRALLNLESTDLAFLLKANFPLYTEQKSSAPGVSHLNKETPEEDQGEEIGVVHGRTYARGLDRPQFIAPSTEPLKASMDKQENLKADIRNLVNLAAATVKSQSAEAKAMDNLGLESGLSNIGLELQEAERSIARIWSAYEGTTDVAKIKYPDRYSLKTDAERTTEANDQLELKKKVPSQTFQRYVNHRVVNILVGDRLPSDELAKIHAEIDASNTPTADPVQLRADAEAGFVTAETASAAIGYPKDEVPKAQAEYAIRLRQIAIAQGGLAPNPQTESGLTNPASRGVAELDPNPNSGSTEKNGKPQRGAANGQA